MLARLKQFSFHYLLLILFFLLHGYSENLGLIPFTDLLVFFVAASACGLLVFYIFKKIVRSFSRAGILTTLVFIFYLFYGPIKDLLRSGFFSPLSRYSVLLPCMLIITLALVFYFRKTSKPFTRLTFFINCVLLIYLLVDAGTIIFSGGKHDKYAVTGEQYTRCDTCFTPDIHLIVMDEYSGSRVLREQFHYSNHWFEDSLRQQGFFVAAAPSSNYSSTPVSMASVFAMDYLPMFGKFIRADDYTRAEQVMNESVTLRFLEAQGYRFMNHSIFDLRGQPGKFKTDLLPTRLKLITAKTMWNSIMKDLGWQLHERVAPKVGWLANALQDDYKNGNQRLLNLTRAEAAKKAGEPRFIYTHVLMPHWPYLLDSAGRETGINFYSANIPLEQRQKLYVEYLAYTNKLMLEMVRNIISQSGDKAAIILMSDHGYREWAGTPPCNWVNNNFVSVYMPGRDYRLLYDSISNVNVLRGVFNTLFNQRFVQQADSCIF